MTSDQTRPLGVAVIRAWLERGSRSGLRVRIVESLEQSDMTSTIVASAEEAGETIRDFVARAEAAAATDPTDKSGS